MQLDLRVVREFSEQFVAQRLDFFGVLRNARDERKRDEDKVFSVLFRTGGVQEEIQFRLRFFAPINQEQGVDFDIKALVFRELYRPTIERVGIKFFP